MSNTGQGSNHPEIESNGGGVEGAHQGIGLGDEFLRHIERTRLLVHLLDVSPGATVAPADAYFIIRNELKQYNPALAEKAEIVVANKMDLLDKETGMKCVHTLDRKNIQAGMSRFHDYGKEY